MEYDYNTSINEKSRIGYDHNVPQFYFVRTQEKGKGSLEKKTGSNTATHCYSCIFKDF